MKQTILATLLGFTLLSGCTTDFEVAADWKDITVVYGLLNLADSVQYIKVNKAYLDPETDALTIAQIPDSLYYDSINVVLERLKPYRRDTLVRVDGNKEGFVKDGSEGTVFASSPNYLYKYSLPLLEDSKYRLIIDKLNGNELIVSQTNIVNRLAGLAFPITINPAVKGRCDFSVWNGSSSSFKLRWESTDYSKIYDFYIRFHYREVEDGVSSCHSFDYKLFHEKTCRDCNDRELMESEVELENFLNFLTTRIKHKDGVTRHVQCFDMIYQIGDNELKTFIDINRAQTGSIVQTQAVLEWTNIENGKGLFSSRFDTIIPNYKLGSLFMTELINNDITKDLGFSPTPECDCDITGTPEFHFCPKEY